MRRHGNQRRLSLYKNKKKVDTTKEKENLTSFTFSEEARGVLQYLFTQYPPDDQDLGDEIVAKHRRRTENLRYNRDDIFNRPLMGQGEIAKKVGSLASRLEKSPDLRQVLFTYHSEFLSFISHDVLVVCYLLLVLVFCGIGNIIFLVLP